MSWSKISHTKFQRSIGENEVFLKLVGDPGIPFGHEHWAINSIASFKPTGALSKTDLPSILLKAWKVLRFYHPSIAAYPVDVQNLQYAVPDAAGLDQWAAETFCVVDNKTADEVIPAIKPSPFATLTYLSSSNEVLCHTSHWRTDGVGVLMLLDTFFGLAASPHQLDPVSLACGEEVSRLAPSVEEAANIPKSPTDAIKAISQKHVETFYQAAGALGIPYKGDLATPPSGTRSVRSCLSPSETEFIVSQCRSKGISVTSAVHASVAAANYALASGETKSKHFTSTIRFGLRPYLPEPYGTREYASGLYTTGWMKAVPASASWIENAQLYNDIYRQNLTREYIKSHRQYALDLGELIRNLPQAEEPPSEVDISSVGIAENLIDRSKGTAERGLEIQSVSVGVEVLTRQCVCFLWTFRGQLNLNLVYNESFHDETDMNQFLEILRKTLLEKLGL